MRFNRLLLVFLLYLSFVSSQRVFSQGNSPKLLLRGEFINNELPLEGVVVKVILDSVIRKTIVADRSGKFSIDLKYKKVYELEFSKKGFITQRIEFSTELPNAVYKQDADLFALTETFKMYELFPGVDVSLFDDYFTKYKWNKDSYHFIIDERYNNRIKKTARLEKLKKDIDKKRTEIYTQEIKKADKLLNKGELEEAGYYYSLASDLKPKDKYTSAQIKLVGKQLKALGALEEGYKKAIEKADKYFKEKDFDKAKEAYKKAVFYDVGEDYPKNKIADIDSIRSQQFLALVNKYDATISTATKYLKDQNYIKARAEFIKAKKLLPEKKLPDTKLKEIDVLEEKQKKLEEEKKAEKLKEVEDEYNSLVKKAYGLFLDKRYLEALDLYNQANSLPIKNTSDVESQIEAIKQLLAGNSIENDKKKKNNEEEKKGLEKKNTDENEDAGLISEKDERNKLEQTQEALEETPASDPDSIENKKMLELYIGNLEKSRKDNDKKEESKSLKSIANIYHAQQNLAKAIDYYEQSIDILKDEGDEIAVSDILEEVAVAFYDSGLFESSVTKYEEAVKIKEKTGDKVGASEILNDIGIVYETTYQFDEAIDYYQKSANLKVESGDKSGLSEVLSNIADVYYQQNELELSLDNYKKSLDVTEEIENEDKKSELMNDIGVTLYELGRYDEAIGYYEKSLNIREKREDKKEASMTLNNIGNVNYDWNDFNNAISYYEKSIALKEEISYKTGIAISLFNIANAYEKLGNFNKALEFYKKSEKEAIQSKASKRVLSSIVYCISRVYTKLDDFKPAYDYQAQYIDYGIFDGKRHKVISEKRDRFEEIQTRKEIRYLRKKIQRQKIQADLEAAKKQKEIEIKNLELRNREAELKKQRLLVLLFASGLVFITLIALTVLKLLQNKRKANVELQAKNKLISTQSKHIQDSIKYARKIQRAAMPQKEILDKYLGEYFILNKPLDIVSGDFYWLSKQDEKVVLTVADCTGHGVPGAMLCMLGISFLDEIVKGKKIKISNHILDTLREQFIQVLHQKEDPSNVSDGIDMALCILDIENRELYYSGAYNPIYIVRNCELTEYKADKMPISFFYRNDKFTSQKIDLIEGDMIYLFSDGYMDQIGGPNNQRIMKRRFKEILQSVCSEPVDRQKEILEEKLTEWMMPDFDQIDDIMVMGIRVT